MAKGGGNSFLGVGGTPHVGIRKDFHPADKGLARRDKKTLPSPPADEATVMHAV
jgi:hypothetical protein